MKEKKVIHKDLKSRDIENVVIIAGSGNLPREIYNSCIKRNVKVEVIELLGEQGEKSAFDGIKTTILPLHSVTKIVNAIRKFDIQNIVLAGKVRRISIPKLAFDLKGAILLIKIIKNGFNDSSILDIALSFLESEGFTIISPEKVAFDIVAKHGNMTSVLIETKILNDIDKGIRILGGISEFDVGQALVIQNGLILGVEAVEGTDELIKRCGEIKQKLNIGPTLIKMCKKNQDIRVDLPCIGDKTIRLLKKHGIKGVAIQAEKSLLINREKMIEFANANNIFIYGFNGDA